ncbi:MAG: alpha/beta-type small acid-soluble spore protein [Romboutsia sp.]
MENKSTNPNAKKALNQLKLEIAGELGLSSGHIDGAYNTSYQNGFMGGRVGGQMSKRLVEMGEQELIRMYNNKQ